MDSLQQQFGGESEIITKKHPKLPILLGVLGLVVCGVAGYWLWPQPAPVPVAEQVVEEVPLSAAEIETYRASLPITTVVEEATELSDVTPTKTSVELVAEGVELPAAEPTSSFVPPVEATPVAVLNSNGEEITVLEGNVSNSIYVEGDTAVNGVIVSQPDTANLKPIEATVVVAAVDVSTNQMMVTSGGEVLTLMMAGGRLQTKDGKLVSLSSISPNDILAISGDQLADAPMVAVKTASFIGVQDIVEVVETI